MNAIDLISLSIPVYDIAKTGNNVFNLPSDKKNSQIPVVDSGKYKGLIDIHSLRNKSIDSFSATENLVRSDIYIYFDTPFYDVIDYFISNSCVVLPVINENDEFIGCIDIDGLLNALANSLTYKIPGSVLTLEIPVIDYSILEICNIIESEKTGIMGLLINDEDLDDNKIELILKLNNKNIDRVIAALERYDYKIKSYYSAESITQDKLREHYDALMHYLNV